MVFYSASDRSYYLGLIRANLTEAGVKMLAYCLMPNHVHLIARPEHADSLAVLLRRVHGRYAQYLNVKRGRSGHVWQNRFFSCPLSERHLWAALRYVERNPVRAGLVSSPQEYRWSSTSAHLTGVDDVGLLDLQFWQDAGGRERWQALHASPEEQIELRLLRRCTYSGRPFGEEAFVAVLEEHFQRSWRRYSFEEQRPSFTAGS